MAAVLVVGKVLGKTFNIDVNKEKCYNTKSGTATNRFACITWMTQHSCNGDRRKVKASLSFTLVLHHTHCP